jgi:hypothetical protein
MAYPPASATGTGFTASGVTTIRWGSAELVTSINGVAVNGTTVGIVTRFHESPIVENMKFPNGNGVSITRVLVVDGQKWDVTIRDDTGITGRPRPGTSVIIVDAGGFIGAATLKYTATVIEPSFETAPKQPGELTISLENLVLIESQTGS